MADQLSQLARKLWVNVLLSLTSTACGLRHAESTGHRIARTDHSASGVQRPTTAVRVESSQEDPFALDPQSPFHLVARGDYDLTLSVTEAGAFVTHLSCDAPRTLIYPKRQEHKPKIWRSYDPWFRTLQIRRASGEAWLDDELAHSPIPEWAYYDATVEAKSPDDVWVDRTPGNLNYSAPHGYFHWNGSVWEMDEKMLTIPEHLTPVALLDWYGTKLAPLLPAVDPYYGGPAKLKRLPLFAVWCRSTLTIISGPL